MYSGPATCLEICGRMLRTGGDPKLWFAEWTKELGLTRKDRAWHEVNWLIETLHVAGTHDQLNMGSIAALEVVFRRLIQYTEAHAQGAENPNWNSAKHFAGTTSALDIVPENMRTYASRLAKEEAELEALRARARGPATASHPGAGAAGTHSNCNLQKGAAGGSKQRQKSLIK